MSEITEHCNDLMNVAVNQVKSAVSNCMLHAAADLNVAADHPSQKVIKDELKARLAKAVDDA